MTSFGVALATAASIEDAERLAELLVGGRLAACVNLLPGIRSIYRWRGKVERADEVLMLIKTSASLLPAIEALLREVHSYDVPELVLLTIEEGSQPYLNWIKESLL